MEPALRVESMGKRYRRGSPAPYQTLRETLMFRGRPATEEEHWAVKDVSFSVRPGEALGIVGRNGAGKTTLLKLLSRITEPTEGTAWIRGMVGSLLEVGTGFHPELTGRENVYLSGAILGMRKREIDRRFDAIVAFAEVERFLDLPVKHYSTGMSVRLAFAVAAHLEPDILIVDEVLAVGDAAFQQRCLGRMGTEAREGRTVLLVSHNLQAISTLTKRALVMDGGRISFDGPTPAALDHYRALAGAGSSGSYVAPAGAEGLKRAWVTTSQPNGIHVHGQPLTFEFEFSFREKPASGAFAFQIVDESGRPVAHLWTIDSEQPWTRKGDVRLRCHLPKARLYMGRYTLIAHLADRAIQRKIQTLEDICPFEVVMDGIARDYPWVPGTCTYLEDASWEVDPRP